MTSFTIDPDNNITCYATPEQAQDTLALGAQLFTCQKELAKASAEWPISRLVETWNGFAGTPGFDDLKPLKKFTDRKVAVNRIWQAIQKLVPAAEQGAQDAPEAATATKEASPKKGANRATRGAREAKPRAARKETTTPREGSKKQIVLDLLSRRNGAMITEIARATGWQNHSIRGFISGNLTKKMGMVVESTKNAAGERTYRIAK